MRKFTEMLEEYYQEHPEEIDGFLEVQFEEYAKDGDLGALLSALHIISRAKGVAMTAQEASLSRRGLQKALPEDGSPKLETANAILHAMGYRLSVQPLEAVHGMS